MMNKMTLSLTIFSFICMPLSFSKPVTVTFKNVSQDFSMRLLDLSDMQPVGDVITPQSQSTFTLASDKLYEVQDTTNYWNVCEINPVLSAHFNNGIPWAPGGKLEWPCALGL